MDDKHGLLQRRINQRKRGTGLQSRTVKKDCCDDNNNKNNNNNNKSGKKIQTCGWIQNSFCAPTKPIADKKPFLPPRPVGVPRDGDKQTTLYGCNSPHIMCAPSKEFSPSPGAKLSNQQIFSNLTSTPIQSSCERLFPDSTTPESHKYVSQHHVSFDEGDSLFADLDLDRVAGSDSANSSRRRSKRIAASVEKASSLRKSSTRKQSRGVRASERTKRQSHRHPILDLQRMGEGDAEGKPSSQVEDLFYMSGDSLFGDTADLSDSLLGGGLVSTSPKNQFPPTSPIGIATPLKCSAVNSASSMNNISRRASTERINKISPQQKLLNETTSPDCLRLKPDSDTSGGKPNRKSIEFRAVSGSQLSFEEEEASMVAELILSPSALQKVKGPPSAMHQSQIETQLLTSRTCNTDPVSEVSSERLSQQDIGPVTPAGLLPRNTKMRRGVTLGVTPMSARSRLLRDRRRRGSDPVSGQPGGTLVPGVRGVDSPAARAARRRAELVEKVVKEVEQERAAAGDGHDLGPFFGLPSKVPQMFREHRGITSLYDWQRECLSLRAVQAGQNLIYSLPTSGGKTLVAEVLMLRELLCKQKDALFILPFVAIVQEKVRTLSPFALDLDFVVDEYAASKGAMPPRLKLRRHGIYVATIEKAASLVNSLIEAGRVNELGMVVVDELHMLGEGGSRGAILEMTLTKLMQAAADTQLIGMSATLNNISDLSKFLHAEVYSNDFRPVELREFVKIEDNIYEIDSKALCPDDILKHSRVCMFKYDTAMRKADPDLITGLVQEVIPDHSCLVFCPTKKNCENVAQLLCKLLPRSLAVVKRAARERLMKILWHEGGGEMCPVLRRTVPYGIAYHHSGLTVDERRLIEDAYLDGVLCLLTCTSTLAAGVNLPAKRVILRAPKVAADFLSRSKYKQMVGRAGRAGLDSSGESILLLEPKDKHMLLDLVSGPCDVCKSSLLYENQKGLRHLLLTTIGLKMTPTLSSVSTFLQKTLCYVQRHMAEGTDVLGAAQGALQSLVDLGLITQAVEEVMDSGGVMVMSTEYKLEVTRLGRAVCKGSIDIDRGPQLYADLRQAQSSLVVANYLHLLYLVTPYDLVGVVRTDWMTYLDQVTKLEADEVKVLSLIGLSEGYIAKKASGQRVRKGVDEAVLGRFYLALVLYNLWQQRSIWEVAAVFRIPRGLVQNILNLASTFAACITHFCQELEEFWAYQDLFANFVKKLSFCFMTDLIPLLEIPGVKSGRARQLYNAGYKTLQQVAHAEPAKLVCTLDHLTKKMAASIVTAAKVLLNERVEALQEEAAAMISTPSDLSPPGGNKRT